MVVDTISETLTTDTTAPTIETYASQVSSTTTIATTTPTNTNTTTTTETTTTTTVTTTSAITTTKATTTEKVVNFPISLNSITHDELVCIKGIGDSTANKILSYRDSIGYFTSRYQLLEINGIGESKMNTIMEYTYIENEDLNYGQEVAQNEQYADNQAYEEYPTGNTVQFPINLNTATFEELCAIPNVNETIAQDILNLHNEIGYFSNTYELLYCESISEQLLSEIEGYIYVG
jgi:competence protein ComEA